MIRIKKYEFVRIDVFYYYYVLFHLVKSIKLRYQKMSKVKVNVPPE